MVTNVLPPFLWFTVYVCMYVDADDIYRIIQAANSNTRLVELSNTDALAHGE